MGDTVQTGEFAELKNLQQKVDHAELPPELKQKVQTMIERAALSFKFHTQFNQFDMVASYIDWVTSLPWKIKSEDKLDIAQAKKILDKNHHGLNELKDRILEYRSVMKLNLDQSNLDPNNDSH